MKAGILTGDRYKNEQEALKKDPIIIGMANEIKMLKKIDFSAWSFISMSSAEYERRGGKLNISIGGPAKAIETILLEAKK